LTLTRARIKILGSLAFIETELGERAVVPTSTLCTALRRLKIEPTWGDKVDCPEIVRSGGATDALYIEYSGEDEEQAGEDGL
jgi:hypothetical protein